MDQIITKVTDGGRIVIPASVRRRLDLSVGDEVVLLVGENEATLLSRAEALRRARAIVRKRIPSGRCLSGELLQDRRRESEFE